MITVGVSAREADNSPRAMHRSGKLSSMSLIIKRPRESNNRGRKRNQAPCYHLQTVSTHVHRIATSSGCDSASEDRGPVNRRGTLTMRSACKPASDPGRLVRVRGPAPLPAASAGNATVAPSAASRLIARAWGRELLLAESSGRGAELVKSQVLHARRCAGVDGRPSSNASPRAYIAFTS